MLQPWMITSCSSLPSSPRGATGGVLHTWEQRGWFHRGSIESTESPWSCRDWMGIGHDIRPLRVIDSSFLALETACDSSPSLRQTLGYDLWLVVNRPYHHVYLLMCKVLEPSLETNSQFILNPALGAANWVTMQVSTTAALHTEGWTSRTFSVQLMDNRWRLCTKGNCSNAIIFGAQSGVDAYPAAIPGWLFIVQTKLSCPAAKTPILGYTYPEPPFPPVSTDLSLSNVTWSYCPVCATTIREPVRNRQGLKWPRLLWSYLAARRHMVV